MSRSPLANPSASPRHRQQVLPLRLTRCVRVFRLVRVACSLHSGEFTTFDFVPGIPAPFNFGLAILLNQKMLTLGEKLQTAPPLLPMLVEGQEFIDAQDELSVLDFMRKYGMPERINEEVFISMAKALDFIDARTLTL